MRSRDGVVTIKQGAAPAYGSMQLTAPFLGWCCGSRISGSRRCSNSSSSRASGGMHMENAGGLENLLLDRPIERVVLPQGRGLRVHCLSDLHVDYKENKAW